MSNALALAAVTSTLQSVLTRSILSDLPASIVTEMNLGNTKISTAPLDRARPPPANANQLNICLFQVAPNAALRNLDTGPGRPPVALELHYLLTAYSANDDDRAAQVLLGQAIRILNDRAILGPTDIRAALRGNDLADQIESVRLSPRTVSLEDLARLWSMSQTPARLSAGYTASVVLIDSATPRRSPLPVLRRGIGVTATSDFGGPELLDLVVPQGRGFALPGEAVQLIGEGLRASEVRVRLRHPRSADAIELMPAAGSNDTRINMMLPADLPAGVHGVTVVLRDAGNERITGSLALPVAPEITGAVQLARSGANVTVTVNFRPPALATQQVALIVGDREVSSPARAVPGPAITKASFVAPLPAGPALLRLRIDEVDSDILDRSSTPPSFNPARRVTIP